MNTLRLSVSHMLCADDTQVYKSCNGNDLPSTILFIEKCLSDIKTWMLSNKLQMNEDKTEVLLVTPKRVAKSEPFSDTNGICVKFCHSLRNLGITLDSTLSLHQHVLNVCRGAFVELRRINSICNFHAPSINSSTSNFFYYNALFLIQLNCVMVYLRVLSLDLSFSSSIRNLSLMSFLTIQYLTCCMLMIRRYINPVTVMICLQPFFV